MRYSIFYKWLLVIVLCSNIYASNLKNNIFTELVDLVEFNHFYDEHGRLVFDQVIYYDWSWQDERYNVRAWRLVKNPGQIPIKNPQDNLFYSFWIDGEQTRNVISRERRETWT